MVIGVFAFQGGFERHAARLTELGVRWTLVKHEATLHQVDGLIIPGGESTTFLRITTPDFRESLRQRIAGGLPVLATCAGVILLAREVTSPAQESLGVLDIAVTRNAYGRQVDSFIDPSLRLTEEGERFVLKIAEGNERRERILRLAKEPLEAVFIRAPRIDSVGSRVTVLSRRDGDPVLVRDRNIIGATFHPELSPAGNGVHELLLAMAGSPARDL